ncbi:MAG: diguanylate cyclase [Comamonadaceae bacterium]|nr:MAG: diguanylate cyclase [Comamonadaceae bacterium]
MLVGSAFAFRRSLRRISLNVALSVIASVFFVFAFLGGLPVRDPDLLSRILAHIATFTACLLAYLLLWMLGVLRSRRVKLRMKAGLALFGAVVLGVGWAMPPANALILAVGATLLLSLAGFLICLRSALRGDRLAWLATLGVVCLLVAVSTLAWIALDRGGVPWPVHVAAAICASAYLACMGGVLWVRYAYLIELHQVMAQGPRYDPVTRMRSHAETGQLVGAVFQGFRDQPAPLGVMVLTVANLYALDKLHGQAALNHALFVCAGRLRRIVPVHVEMGRLGNDGFLLMMRNCSDTAQLIRLAQTIQTRLSRSVSINTTGDVATIETDNTPWTAEIGIGVLIVSQPAVRGPAAIAMGRGMSRTAMSYASRIACYDKATGQITELHPSPRNSG